MPTDAKLDPTDSAWPNLSFREYAKYVSPIVWVDDTPWRIRGRVLTPLCMPHVPLDVDRTELRNAIAEHKALLACWTTEWDALDSSEWWWTCCDHDIFDIEKIDSSRGRRSIRKGLRECTVRRVAVSDFSQLAYPIYRTALESYNERPPTEVEFVEQMERLATYPGTEFWSAFYGDKVAGFATCQVLDDAVTLGSTKSAPELDKYNPNAALFYSISQYYLGNGLRYVSNGSRTLWHPSSINEFLERLGFRKVFCRVNVELSPVAKIIDKSHLAKWGSCFGLQRLFGKKWVRLEGFQKLVRIAETFK